jgi:2-keto-4-pentenoate hydratase
MFPGRIPPTLAAAYHVQDLAIGLMQAPITGWKVGRILPPQAALFGAERLAGPIYSVTRSHQEGYAAAIGRIFAGGFGAAEAELLLRLGVAPPARQMRFTLDEAASLIDCVHAGIEIASSPLASINELGPPVIVSDFGNNNGLVIGPEIENWRGRDIAAMVATLAIDGQTVGTGCAATFIDGPIGSVRFLLEVLADRGIMVPPGTWISSGAITGVHKVVHGQDVEVRFDGRYATRCRIEHVPCTRS